VQVKTNGTPLNYWLLGKHAANLKSDSHIYVFVTLRKNQLPEYIVALSTYVAGKVATFTSKTGSVWYSFSKKDRPSDEEGWEIFGDPHASPEPEERLPETDGEPLDEISN
jgi:hypothetical protein